MLPGINRSARLTILLVLLAGLMAPIGGCGEDEEPVIPPPPAPTLAYAGSDVCADCHRDQYAPWVESGHPYAMTKSAGESPAAGFPEFSAFHNDPASPPAGTSWAEVPYAIGGYGWRMHWLDPTGFLLTQASDTQYNFEDQTRAAFLPDDPPGTRTFDCGRCHATGWLESDDGDATNNQDGLEGLVGTFFAGGVHCEACHGMGSFHVEAPEEHTLTVDRSSESCAGCHRREADDTIAVQDGFIVSGQQYSEWLHSPHSADGAPGCNDCHDPHSSSKLDDVAAGRGTTKTCTSCHPGFEGPGNHPPPTTCVDCHMPKAARSAIAPEFNVADVRTHIINISLSFSREDSMFNEAGDEVRLDDNGQAAITGDFICMVCHTSNKEGPHYLSPSELRAGMDGKGRMHTR